MLGILILPGCSQGILESIGTKTAVQIAEDDIEVVEAAENMTGQDLEGQIDTGDWITAESAVELRLASITKRVSCQKKLDTRWQRGL
ncbi:hypothetical protein [Peribacillus sp. V2I11]|uniref:hypothetical protein n=1 Tax=Peribacillus sp. V2I11 TaxID=3042277 RepID=UPI0027D80395|nr:hypothetical protein [Peribacillus sp. V2I11]